MDTRVLTNAQIHTFNPEFPTAQAAVIENGKFVAVGNTASIISIFGSKSEIEDLEGLHLYPGFTDAHIHLLEYGLSLSKIDCETPSKKKCLEIIRKATNSQLSGNWILGHGWNQNVWRESYGTKEELDEISSSSPIFLTHKSLHSAWVNSKALAKAGITAGTSNPPNGEIRRDESGTPTGILFEGAVQLVEKVIPKPTQGEITNAILKAQTNLNLFGITAVHDFDSWECYRAIQELNRSGELSLRVVKNIPLPNFDEAIGEGLMSGMGDDFITTGWLKIFSDGALGPQTAAMLEPYCHSNSKGMLFLSRKDIALLGEKALSNGISLAVHAIGDRANCEVLNAFEDLESAKDLIKPLLNPRIEHVQLIQKKDRKRMGKMNIIASMQPIHAISDREMAELHWGKRCENAYGWKTIQNAEGLLIFGSDAPVESPNPFAGLFAATTRLPLKNSQNVSPWYPDQCLTITDAINCYIRNPHVASKKEKTLGLIAPGYFADLFALHEDIENLDLRNIMDLSPVGVMVNGKWITSPYN